MSITVLTFSELIESACNFFIRIILGQKYNQKHLILKRRNFFPGPKIYSPTFFSTCNFQLLFFCCRFNLLFFFSRTSAFAQLPLFISCASSRHFLSTAFSLSVTLSPSVFVIQKTNGQRFVFSSSEPHLQSALSFVFPVRAASSRAKRCINLQHYHHTPSSSSLFISYFVWSQSADTFFFLLFRAVLHHFFC